MSTDFSRVVLLHDEMLSPTNAALTTHPDLPRVFIFDTGDDAHLSIGCCALGHQRPACRARLASCG